MIDSVTRTAIIAGAALLISGCWTWQSRVALINPETRLAEPILTPGHYCLLEDYDDGVLDYAAAEAFRDCGLVTWDAKSGRQAIASLTEDGGSEPQPFGVARLESGLVLLQLPPGVFSADPVADPLVYALGVATPDGFLIPPPPDETMMLEAIDAHPARFAVTTGSYGSVTIDAGPPDAISAVFESTALYSVRHSELIRPFNYENGGHFYLRFDDPARPPTAAEAEAAVRRLMAALRAVGVQRPE